jgi:hypothetical protein
MRGGRSSRRVCIHNTYQNPCMGPRIGGRCPEIGGSTRPSRVISSARVRRRFQAAVLGGVLTPLKILRLTQRYLVSARRRAHSITTCNFGPGVSPHHQEREISMRKILANATVISIGLLGIICNMEAQGPTGKLPKTLQAATGPTTVTVRVEASDPNPLTYRWRSSDWPDR